MLVNDQLEEEGGLLANIALEVFVHLFENQGKISGSISKYLTTLNLKSLEDDFSRDFNFQSAKLHLPASSWRSVEARRDSPGFCWPATCTAQLAGALCCRCS